MVRNNEFSLDHTADLSHIEVANDFSAEDISLLPTINENALLDRIQQNQQAYAE